MADPKYVRTVAKLNAFLDADGPSGRQRRVDFLVAKTGVTAAKVEQMASGATLDLIDDLDRRIAEGEQELAVMQTGKTLVWDQDGRQMILANRVVDRMIERGYVTRQNARLQMTVDYDTAVAEVGVCDFCSADHPTHMIDVEDFDMPAGAGRSRGGWAACDTCAGHVERNERIALFKRSLMANAHDRNDARSVHHALTMLHEGFWQNYDRKHRRHHDPRPWMEALEMQFATLADMERIGADHDREIPAVVRAANTIDMAILRRAECYAWGPEPVAAVRLAARTVPGDTVLTRNVLPGSSGAGWWYFPGPIPVKTTTQDDSTVAILWGWGIGNRPAQGDLEDRARLMFSAYVMGRVPGPSGHLRHIPIGSQVWRWFEGESIQDMLTRCGHEYDLAMKDRQINQLHYERNSKPYPKEDTLRATADLSRFFMAGCAWLHQRILTMGSGHVERHRRKQLAREHRLDVAPMDVKVVALRRVEVQQGAVRTPGSGDAVDWSCRWIVDGHFRNQAHGKGHAEHRLIWIGPYVKGPDDKPLKVPTAKVFTVVR